MNDQQLKKILLQDYSSTLIAKKNIEIDSTDPSASERKAYYTGCLDTLESIYLYIYQELPEKIED